ncbi:hypothetical protein [Paraglaciecola sp. L1A13]|uniref:hypothetical protein n=1 Tax=Paraglaciecola sp. L1A13 TaxID=2686359 RepID=UPI00131B0DB2|nr:hypothetical protein [Paraglaciecola sp. L1A13]
MKKNVDTPIDILELSYVIERDSQSGDLSRSLLQPGHTLYEPDPKVPRGLRRHLPSGNIELSYWQDGKFVVAKINPERESDN